MSLSVNNVVQSYRKPNFGAETVSSPKTQAPSLVQAPVQATAQATVCNPDLNKKKEFSTTAKVISGLSALALVGTAAYFIVHHKTKDAKSMVNKGEQAIEHLTKSDEENALKNLHYKSDGKTLDFIDECDPKTGNVLKRTGYQSGGKTLDYISEYDSETGNVVKKTNYKSDGKTLDYMTEYDSKTGNKLKETVYQLNGKIDYVAEYDLETGNVVKQTGYQPDGKTIEYITECDPKTGDKIKQTHYKEDGITVDYID